MSALRDVIVEALNAAYDPAAGDWRSRHDEHAGGYYALCHVCRGDVGKLADAVRDALVAGEWIVEERRDRDA